MYRPCFLFLCNAQKSKKNNEGVEARSDDVMLKVGAAVTPDVDENRDEDVASLPKLTFDENNETSEKNIDNMLPVPNSLFPLTNSTVRYKRYDPPFENNEPVQKKYMSLLYEHVRSLQTIVYNQVQHFLVKISWIPFAKKVPV